MRHALTIALCLLVAVPAIAQPTYSAANYNEAGGARTVIGGDLDIISGGNLDVESGGDLTILSGATLTLNSGAVFAGNGTSTFEDLTVSDDLTVTDDALISGALTVTEGTTLTGNVIASGTVDVAGTATFNNPVKFTLAGTDSLTGSETTKTVTLPEAMPDTSYVMILTAKDSGGAAVGWCYNPLTTTTVDVTVSANSGTVNFTYAAIDY